MASLTVSTDRHEPSLTSDYYPALHCEAVLTVAVIDSPVAMLYLWLTVAVLVLCTQLCSFP